jgi:deoxyribodipyrimidine photolyase-related protein
MKADNVARALDMRNLIVVLGDQLDRESTVLEDFDPARDAIWMAECTGESTHVWSHKARIALFLASMRHFRDDTIARGWPTHYRALGEHTAAQLDQALGEDLRRLKPERIVLVRPGEWRLREALRAVAKAEGVDYAERPDRHFFIEPDDFTDWLGARREIRMEHFYRWMRRRFGVLMEGDEPAGGHWNYDHDNRKSFGAKGPGMLPGPKRFAPDAITGEVLLLVAERFSDHPGSLASFDWPVTPAQAQQALDDFIDHRLPAFGQWQDAMWSGEPWLYHARLSTAMNLKLLDPRKVVQAAEKALRDGRAELRAVEGFVRQVLGWREFIRGMYWRDMPKLLEGNALKAHAPLPSFYWTGDTDMHCLRDAVQQTMRHGYAHHIQRLMVTGNLALMLGVEPAQVHAWYLAVYVDAVEWVEAPNTLAMSQFADGGRMVSKPYCASGRYIERMSNYCGGCRYKPEKAVGDDACPFTTLYWDFLDRHQTRFAHHPRAALQWKSLERLDAPQREAIGRQAAALRKQWLD